MSPAAMEQTRPAFEDLAFNKRFQASIVRNPNPPQPKIAGALDFVSIGCPTKEEFLKRDTDGHYEDDLLDAMWWGWQEGVKHMARGVEKALGILKEESIEPHTKPVGD